MDTFETLRDFTIKVDTKTVAYLTDEVRKKRTAGTANSFSDIFLIRLTEALNNKQDSQVFRVKRPAAK
jgi:hypothetical protein